MKLIIKNTIIYLIISIIPFLLIPQIEKNLYYTLPLTFIVFISLFKLEYPLLFIPFIVYYRNDYLNILPLLLPSIGLTMFMRYFFLKNKYYIIMYTGFLILIVNYLYILSSSEAFNFYFYSINLILSLLLITNMLYATKLYNIGQKNNLYKISNITYLHAIVLLTLFLCSTTINSNLSLIVGLVSIMYLSYIDSKEISFIFSLVAMLTFNFYLKIDHLSLLFPLFSIIFLKSKIYINISLSFLIVLDLYMFNFFSKIEDYILISVLLGFEIIKYLLNYFPYYNKNKTILPIYNNMVNNFNDQILQFSSFLDDFSRNFLSNSDESYKVNECFNNLINSYCFKCRKSKACFSERKNETYLFFKNCLTYGNDIHYKKNTSELKLLINNCMFSDEIINKANMLKNKYQIYFQPSTLEKTLEKQISGISNTLRQYVVDLSVKKDISLFKLSNLRNRLLDLGYDVILFNIKKAVEEDFWIEIGISDMHVEELKLINIISKEVLDIEHSIEFKEEINNVVYFSIIPSLTIKINYGYNKLAKQDLSISGDNYLIKNVENGNFIAAISDGMGSGFKAFQESKNTLRLIDKITEFEINTSTSINILNTFYALKESFDFYATLDLIKINKSSRKATLYKMGGTNTYIVHNNTIKTIFNENLPFGVSDLIKYDEYDLEPNDLIIMSTDGIIDNLDKKEIEDILLYSKYNEPQKIAYDIISLVQNKKEKIEDDMSVIVLKVEKN